MPHTTQARTRIRISRREGELTAHAANSSAHHTKTVDASELTAGTLAVERLPLNAVTGAHVQDASLTGSDLAPASVSGDRIAAGSVAGDRLGAGAVGMAQLATASVDSSRIANGSISPADFAAGAVGRARSLPPQWTAS